MKKKINAPFRWAGSKAKLTNELVEIFEKKKVYAEGFLGSGIVLFRLLQEKRYDIYFVNDINVSIISFYKAIKEDSIKVCKDLIQLSELYNSLEPENQKQMYYEKRELFNRDKSQYVLFWFLMKAGFNGLYRENKKGEYNAPFGYKSKLVVNVQEIQDIGFLLNDNDVRFYNLDYREFYNQVEKEYKDIFSYNDPPYCQSQDYTAEKFDNKLLSRNLINKSYPLLISDIDTPEANETYSSYNKLFVKEIKRVIQIKNIKTVREVVFTNFAINRKEQLSLF